jgi:hypothetical protein
MPTGHHQLQPSQHGSQRSIGEVGAVEVIRPSAVRRVCWIANPICEDSGNVFKMLRIALRLPSETLAACRLWQTVRRSEPITTSRG